MTAPAASLPRMTSDEFLVWAEAQSDAKFELHDGAVVAMAGERRLQGMVKGNAFRAFDGVLPDPCHAYVDGIAVRVSERTTFIPDVVVDCGNQDDLTEMTAASPVIVVEVLSDSTAMIDTGIKLEGYFAVPSIAHYLVVDGWNRRVTWHSRDQECWRTSILRAGAISLDPPGISVSTDDFWRGLPEEGAVQ